MKAIRKSDGKEVDVVLYTPLQYISVETEESKDPFFPDSRLIYDANALILEEPTDWGAFRREAAKDILCAFIIHSSASSHAVDLAVEYADKLIKKLQEKV